MSRSRSRKGNLENSELVFSAITRPQMSRFPPTYMFLTNRTNTGEEGLRETKNNDFGLAEGRQYQLQRTKDVRPGQV